MGLYLNPGNETFAELVQADIYVDKTGLIAYMNGCIGKAKHLIASSRPRRFGKSMAADMLAAYYDRETDSRKLFEKYPAIRQKLWKGQLWNHSYYVETIGSVSEENIRRYIEHQSKSY